MNEMINLAKYIILPQTTTHPDLLISEQVTDHGYDHNQYKELLEKEDCFMLSFDLLAEFLKMCKSGKAHNGLGNQVDPAKLEQILGEISESRTRPRGGGVAHEFLDDRYSKQDNQLQVAYHKFDSSGKLIEVTENLDQDTLIENSKINLEGWINGRDRTSQGLPRTKISSGRSFYRPPEDGRVAWLAVWLSNSAGGICLGGDDFPLASEYPPGVRRAKILDQK